MRIIPFCGYPICIIKTGEILNDNELSFLRSLDNKQHMETLNTRTKLTKSVNILNNNELKRVHHDDMTMTHCFPRAQEVMHLTPVILFLHFYRRLKERIA